MKENPIAEALSQRKDAIYYSMGIALRKEFPDRYLLETDHPFFGFEDFIESEMCEASFKEDFPNELSYLWDEDDGVETIAYNAWIEVGWQGKQLQIFEVSIHAQHCRERKSYVLAENREVAESFFGAVCRWTAEAHEEIFVFADGCWQKSAELFNAVKSAKLADLVLAGSLKEEIVSDFRAFFDGRDLYVRHGIPWKRGVLFLGPPGNGKTHMIKSLINELDVPCLYVRSFSAEYRTAHHCIGEAFKRARKTAPCVFVFEDLDAMIDSQNRSFFLNEMDGFYANEGILTIATTNHPERLDPAILDRPSRFDRKYHFELPAVDERERYIALVNAQREERLRLDDGEIGAVVEGTDGFSFAYLKELFLSSMMAWMKNEGAVPMSQVVTGQISALRSQMASPESEFDQVGGDEGEGPMQAMMRQFGGRGFRTVTRYRR